MNKVKKGDTVVVIAGKDNGKESKVLSVIPSEKGNKVVVEGVNIAKIHRKAKTQTEKSEIVKVEKAIDASNVMVKCPVCGKPTRVGFTVVDGKKVRICKKCGAVIADVEKRSSKEDKKAKKATKKTEKTGETKTRRVRKTAAGKKEIEE
jgi:large subunit ribosomal protein L24